MCRRHVPLVVMRLLVGILAFAVLGYVLLLGLLYGQQSRILYPASPQRISAQEAGLTGFTDVEIVTADGERLVGWWKPPEAGRALLLYFHGNGGSLINRRERARSLTADGRGLLIVSYRGYSGSTGSPSEAGLRRDAEAAYRYLGSYQPSRIAVYGESLGTGVAVWLASQNPIGGLILDAPFTSIADVARGIFWFAPLNLLLKDQYRSIDRVAEVKAPLLIMHGDRDGTIPIALGEALFAAAREPKRFEKLGGIDHVSVLEGGGLAHVRAFLADLEQRLRASVPQGDSDASAGPTAPGASTTR